VLTLNKLKKLINSRIGKSILLITGGTAFAQLINTLLYPIITRIYSPDEYGVLIVFIAIVGVLSVGAFKYELAIPIADDDEKAMNIMFLSIMTLLIYVGLISMILILFGESVLGLFNGEVLLSYIFFIILGVFLTGLYEILVQWGFREKNYRVISKTIFSQSISQNITVLGLGLLSLGSKGLLIGNLFGKSAGIINLSKLVIKKFSLKKINRKELLWSIKRYKKFPLYTAPSHIFGSLGNKLPIIFITSMYGVQTVGFYGLSYAIVNIPSVLIGKSVGDVFYGEAASIGRVDPSRIKNLSNKLLRKLFLIGIFPFIALLLGAPLLFSMVFGESWYESGVYASIISSFIFVRLIFSPISRVFEVFEKQKEKLFLDVFRVILVLLAFGISKIMGLNSYWAVGLYTITMSGVHILTYLLAQKVLNEEIKKKSMDTSDQKVQG